MFPTSLQMHLYPPAISYGATFLFAGNLEGKNQKMRLAIYLGFESDPGLAIALSVLLVIFSVTLLGVTPRLENRSPANTNEICSSGGYNYNNVDLI